MDECVIASHRIVSYLPLCMGCFVCFVFYLSVCLFVFFFSERLFIASHDAPFAMLVHVGHDMT